MSDEASSNYVRCKACRNDILLGARKCIHCGSYQDWRNIATVVGGIIPPWFVALIAILTAGVASYRYFSTPFNSNILYSIQNADENILLLGYNSGIRPGTFASADLDVSGYERVHLTDKTNNEVFIIESGKDKILHLAPAQLIPTIIIEDKGVFAEKIKTLTCTLSVNGGDFYGEKPPQAVPVRCDLISTWFYKRKCQRDSLYGVSLGDTCKCQLDGQVRDDQGNCVESKR
jgi:hypothetical protein